MLVGIASAEPTLGMPATPALDQGGARVHAGLLARIANYLQVFDDVEAGAAIGDIGVE